MPNVPNYAREMDKVLQSLEGRRPRLLLHACCGPCSSAVLEQLCPYFEITVLYYNPNIWPPRNTAAGRTSWSALWPRPTPWGVKVVEDRYDPQESTTPPAAWKTSPSGEPGAPPATGCGCAGRRNMRRRTVSTGSPPPCPSAPTKTPPGSTRSGRSWPPPSACPISLGFQEEKRLPALPATVGSVRPVPAGLLRGACFSARSAEP